MVWQDIVLMISSIIMGYALIPQIYMNFRKKKCGINLQTSSVTFVALFVAAFVYFTLSLFFTFILTVFAGILWFVLFVQKKIYC